MGNHIYWTTNMTQLQCTGLKDKMTATEMNAS